MRKVIALLLLFLAVPVLAQDSVRLRSKEQHREALGGRCVIDAKYVEVEGRPDLNAKLKGMLPKPCSPDDLLPGQGMSIEQDFEVTYNGHGLLSVFGSGIASLTRDGRMDGAHPTKLFNGIILDIKTGREYSLRDLFGADVYQKLDGILAERAAQEAGSDEVRPLTEHTYHAYLSKTGVTFYQIFDNFAMGSLEVTIPYEEALKLASPDGPLKRIKL